MTHKEAIITFTYSELRALLTKVQDLALAGAYVYLPGMRGPMDYAPAAPAPAPPSTPSSNYVRTRKPQARIPDEKKQEVIALYKKGYTAKNIGLLTNLLEYQVWSIINTARRTKTAILPLRRPRKK